MMMTMAECESVLGGSCYVIRARIIERCSWFFLLCVGRAGREGTILGRTMNRKHNQKKIYTKSVVALGCFIAYPTARAFLLLKLIVGDVLCGCVVVLCCV